MRARSRQLPSQDCEIELELLAPRPWRPGQVPSFNDDVDAHAIGNALDLARYVPGYERPHGLRMPSRSWHR